MELFSAEDRYDTENLCEKRPDILENLRSELPPWYSGYKIENDIKTDRKEHK